MKKHIIGYSLLASLAFMSCEDFKFGDKFLEKPISDEMNIDSVYAKKVYAEQALNQVYHSLPDFMPHNNRLNWGVLESITDLADHNKAGGSLYHKGTLTSSESTGSAYSMMYNEEHGEFSATYGIRQAYIFLENVDRVPDMTEEEKRIRKGEAKMIIAYHYVQMFRNLGGMPWVDHAYKPDDDMNMERMTVEEAVQKICALIDEAAELLPWSVSAADDGRMTAAGALALKSRLLLFAASPLFNSNEPYMAGEAADKHYVWWGNQDNARWQDALDAGLDFLRKNQENGEFYKLVDTGNPRNDFYTGYFERYNKEVLISSHRWIRWDLNGNAINQVRYLVCTPTLNYVDMFQMKDGTEFSWDNPDHRDYPFFDADGNELRDPRLYETVVLNGDKFWAREAEIYQGGREQPKFMGGGQNWRWAAQGYTGFAMRKHVQDQLNELQNKFYQCPLMRLPEVYLNIAEAMNELGIAEQRDEFGRTAYDYVNLVRGRVDMWPLTPERAAPGEALREAILKERALEFGYEEVRYYDIVRWKHKDYLDVPLRRLEIYPDYLDPDDSKKPVKQRHFHYEIKEGMENRRVWVEEWSNRYYLCPIPLEEINKKYGLVQNPGW